MLLCYLQIAEEEIDKLFNMTSLALLEMESLLEERRRVLRLLNLNEEGNSVRWRLDEEIKRALQAAAQSTVSSRSTAEVKRNETEELMHLIGELRATRDEDLLGKDRDVLQLQDELANMDVEVYRQDMSVERLRRRCLDASEELDEWKERCAILAKGKRLVYMYQRYGAQSNTDLYTVSLGSVASTSPRTDRACMLREAASASARPRSKKMTTRKSAISASPGRRATSEILLMTT